MRGPPERVNSSQAIASIRECVEARLPVLGVDGFMVVPDGFVADLDLVLDVSNRNLTIEEAAMEAEAFVVSHERPDLVWEVWTEGGELENGAAIEEQVRANLPKLDGRPEFSGDRIWVTFYVCGAPEQLEGLSVALGGLGWTNLDGFEGGFLYPKVKVGKTVSAIMVMTNQLQDLCAVHGSSIVGIDADTTPDLHSRMVTLYNSPA